jgi:hypothetical protein
VPRAIPLVRRRAVLAADAFVKVVEFAFDAVKVEFLLQAA